MLNNITFKAFQKHMNIRFVSKIKKNRLHWRKQKNNLSQYEIIINKRLIHSVNYYVNKWWKYLLVKG